MWEKKVAKFKTTFIPLFQKLVKSFQNFFAQNSIQKQASKSQIFFQGTWQKLEKYDIILKHIWSDGRVVERGGLENRWTFAGSGGSNRSRYVIMEAG